MSSPIAALRHADFARLDDQHQVYLDYTGSALSPTSLLSTHLQQAEHTILGNPHSLNPSSSTSTHLIDETRRNILSFFNADPSQYAVIFTANASSAIKLVAESFPFRRASTLLLSSDNHNSVLGTREFARRAGAFIKYIPLTSHLRLPADLHSHLNLPRYRGEQPPSLFAYPAQSNFSGVKHPLSHIATARSIGWYTLLDAAAFVPSSPFDLSQCTPDFVPISFYKMFGFPTGVGALIVRRACLPLLRRPWFAGGTVRFSSVQTGLHVLHRDTEAFEDGTVNFALIGAVSHGLRYMQAIGMDNVLTHVLSLTKMLLHKLKKVKWQNGRRVVRLYGPEDMRMRGGCIALNIMYDDGNIMDPKMIEHLASTRGISVRVGCFCNPGTAEHAFEMPREAVRECVLQANGDIDVEQVAKCVGKGVFGCVRVSVGLANNERDVRAFVDFVRAVCARGEYKGEGKGKQEMTERRPESTEMERLIV